MAQKHLHELLQDDQEPFNLKCYIADKQCQIKTSTNIQLKKPKSIPTFHANICKKACFFNLTNSPRKSSLLEFTSPVRRSPCKSPKGMMLLHVPARTAAVLLEAALRIQKNNNNNNYALTKKNGFGLFGSMLNKLKQKSKTEKSSVKDMLKWESFVSRKCFGQNGENDVKSHSCELSNDRVSSAVWSESNEETKSFDIEYSSSSCSCGHSGNEFEFVCKQQRDELVLDCFKNEFCESPFRFFLQRSPSPGRRTPEFPSPTSSPGPHYRKQEICEEVESTKKFQGEYNEADEDKDQFSPVSVVDPSFQDHKDRPDGDYEVEDEGYENVQRAKQLLLQMLHRFEKLAKLDPIELEKRILEHENGDEANDLEDGGCDDNKFELLEQVTKGTKFVTEVCQGTNLLQQHYIPKDMKRLISDLIAEEEQIQSSYVDIEVTVKRVCQRLESWKEVEYNTIDMMVEQDLKID